MGPLPLLRAEDSLLLLVGMQTRLAAAMPPGVWARARDSATLLVRAAAELSLPVVMARQSPEDLGDTDPEIAQFLPDHTERLDRTRFAVTEADGFDDIVAMSGRSQVVVCGMETHVGVLQTVSGLMANGLSPFLVADGVCAREERHARSAIGRMQHAGVPMVSGESALFEWLRDARHERFETLAALLR